MGEGRGPCWAVKSLWRVFAAHWGVMLAWSTKICWIGIRDEGSADAEGVGCWVIVRTVNGLLIGSIVAPALERAAIELRSRDVVKVETQILRMMCRPCVCVGRRTERLVAQVRGCNAACAGEWGGVFEGPLALHGHNCCGVT